MNEVLINEFSISAPLGNCQYHQLAFNLNNNTNKSTAYISLRIDCSNCSFLCPVGSTYVIAKIKRMKFKL